MRQRTTLGAVADVTISPRYKGDPEAVACSSEDAAPSLTSHPSSEYTAHSGLCLATGSPCSCADCSVGNMSALTKNLTN